MRLNKYLAQSGVSSRREADELIQGATVTVYGIVEISPAYNVQSSD